MRERRDIQSDQDGDATLAGADLPRGTDEHAGSSARPDAAAPEGDDARRQLETDLTEQRDRYLRLAAEYDNFRKRMQRERVEGAQRAQGELVRQLLDALDDLARFAHVDPSTVDASTVVQGAEMVEKKLQKALAGAGLTSINPLDQPFDPALHEAVATEPALSREDDHMVARVFQPGYQFGTMLLRPARVVVKQWNG